MRMVLLRVGIAEEVVQLVRPLDTAIDSLQFHKESENLSSEFLQEIEVCARRGPFRFAPAALWSLGTVKDPVRIG